MANYLAIPTLAGQAAMMAAAMPDPTPMVISELVVGDGGGFPTVPLETQTALVNQRAVVPVSAVERDQNKMTIDGILDEVTGGWTVREIGILDADGILLFVASVPPTDKATTAENVEDVLTLGVVVVISDTAQVLLSVEGLTYATHDYVNNAILNLRTNIKTPLRPYHLAVKSMALAAPPVAPSMGDAYIVAADPTGAWLGKAGQLTQFVGSGTWVFVDCPNGHLVGDEATGHLYQKIGGVWAIAVPRNSTGAKRWLQDNNGIRTWVDPRDLDDLAKVGLSGSIQLPTWNASTKVAGKTDVNDIVQSVTLSDYLHSEAFFLGMM